jgi:hypothetical protein
MEKQFQSKNLKMVKTNMQMRVNIFLKVQRSNFSTNRTKALSIKNNLIRGLPKEISAMRIERFHKIH